jgi:acetyl-CoA carboxylase carboxyl transferase subunit beta
VRTGVGKSKGKESFAVWILPLLVDQWELWVRISRGINHSIKKQHSFVMISKSGGARMMEAAYSLMQLAKTL